MKAIVLFLLLTSFLPAKTWIELAKEADYHLDHPGRRITEPEDDPRRLEYLELNVETITKILGGDPAVLPVDVNGPEAESPTGDLMMGLVNLSQLTHLRATQQKWSQVNDLFKLAYRVRTRILASEPSLIWFMVATNSGPYTAFECLDEASRIETPAKRDAVFSILNTHQAKLRTTRSEWTTIERGETKFNLEMTKDLKGYLRSINGNLDRSPLFWRKDFPHKVTVRELLDFPFNHKQFETDTLRDLKRQIRWIRSGEPIDMLQKTIKKRLPRPLSFYRDHPNGLGELMRDATPPNELAIIVNHSLCRNLVQGLAWHWLSLERNGQAVTDASQVLTDLPEPLKKKIEEFHLKVLPRERRITASTDSVFGQAIESDITIPNLFPN